MVIQNLIQVKLSRLSFFFLLFNTKKLDDQLRQCQLQGIILETPSPIQCHSDKFHALAMKKTNFNLAKAKQERETQLV